MTVASDAKSDTGVDLAREWDVVIIGTGIGGATVGQALAHQGFSVLFLEKGGRIPAGLPQDEAHDPEVRMTRGWWPHPISQRRPDGQALVTASPVREAGRGVLLNERAHAEGRAAL